MQFEPQKRTMSKETKRSITELLYTKSGEGEWRGFLIELAG